MNDDVKQETAEEQTNKQDNTAAETAEANMASASDNDNSAAAGSSDEDDAASEYNDTAAKIDELENSIQEANDKYIRLYAEYDNYRKRTAKEKTETYNNAASNCIESILPVIDSFERSLDSECTDENFKNGMRMIFNQFKDILTKMNVTEVEALGKEFDPKLHNAISKQDSEDYDSGCVCMVYQKGYKLGERLIRPATVAVAN